VNLFAFSESPHEAARFHCDAHVVKMILETAQMMSTAVHVLEPEAAKGWVGLYKPTHINHPCSVWVRASSANYEWTSELACGLIWSFRDRFGHSHKTEGLLALLTLFNPSPEGPLTPFAQAMPEECKGLDPVAAYKRYFNMHKQHIARWRNGQPDWYQAAS
jgi:hypothetical protein